MTRVQLGISLTHGLDREGVHLSQRHLCGAVCNQAGNLRKITRLSMPRTCELGSPDLSCRSLVTQDFLDYCCGVGGYVGLGGDGLTGDLDGDLA